MLDIISLGDATLDTFIEIDEATLTCQLNTDQCLLCLNFADKIPIKTSVKKVAGNAANVAVGAARLGLKSAFWTMLGDDQFAKEVMTKMKKEGVSSKYVVKVKGAESNYAVVLNFRGERTQLIYRHPREYVLPKLAPAKYVYLTAMGDNHHVVYKDLINYLSVNKVKMAYNPDKTQIRCQNKICQSLYSYAEVLFVNKDEASLILEGKEPKQHKGTQKMPMPKVKDLLKRLHKLGPQLVVITDGVNGSYAYDGHHAYSLPIFPGPLLERTGAGDSYSIGFLSAIIEGYSTSEAMRWGTFNSWSVVQSIGPQDGLLKVGDIKRLCKNNPKFKAKII